MKIDILADENVHYEIIKKLRTNGFFVISIMEKYSGISDVEVLAKCVENKALLLTEDSDFGEWIFSHHKQNKGVIFLRYKFDQLDRIIEQLIFVLNKYNIKLNSNFTVLTAQKIRMRSI